MSRLLPLLLLVACALDDRDLDGDGVPAPQDCDDLDRDVNPFADEVLADGIDQDCDGVDLLRTVTGQTHRCGLTDDGLISCEGDNAFGQLDVPDGRRWTGLASGAFHTCALDLDGSIGCWGDDRFGQASPPAISGATEIDATDWASSVELGGELVCWGLCRLQPGRR